MTGGEDCGAGSAAERRLTLAGGSRPAARFVAKSAVTLRAQWHRSGVPVARSVTRPSTRRRERFFLSSQSLPAAAHQRSVARYQERLCHPEFNEPGLGACNGTSARLASSRETIRAMPHCRLLAVVLVALLVGGCPGPATPLKPPPPGSSPTGATASSCSATARRHCRPWGTSDPCRCRRLDERGSGAAPGGIVLIMPTTQLQP